VAELLLCIALVDGGGRGEACSQGMPGIFPPPLIAELLSWVPESNKPVMRLRLERRYDSKSPRSNYHTDRTSLGHGVGAIATCDEFYGGWRLAMCRIGNGAVAEISPQIKQTFQQAWLEHKHMGLKIGSRPLLCRALRQLLPPYCGPAVTLYRGATLQGWRDGVSWTSDIKIARLFFREDFTSLPDGPTPVIIKTLAPPEAIICRIEYPPPFTDAEKAETPGASFMEFHDEQEYIVDSSLLIDFEIIERA
jgi:hypothetical protein